MGVTETDAIVQGPDGREEAVRFLVDSGATYSLLPYDTWQRLGLEATRRVPTVLADGTVIERDVSECLFILPEGRSHSPVFLGEPGDQALLGVVTLENLGLVLNPFTRKLYPMRMLLA
jgi:predicted aspartyl protease